MVSEGSAARRALIHAYGSDLEARWEKMPTTAKRWQVVFGGSRKKVWLDVPGTNSRLSERMAKCGQVVLSETSPQGIRLFAVTCVSNTFRLVSCFVPFQQGMLQRQYALDHQLTDIVLTKHAIDRWLERNDSLCVADALTDLARATLSLNLNIGVMTLTQGVVPVGFVERQVRCPGGGVAIIKVDNPEEERFPDMRWQVVTYISESMIKHWNEAAVAAEFESVAQRW